MELVYLWIERYNNIYKQGFNFCSEYEFDFDYEKNILQFNTLEPKKIKLFDDAFLNITAIIGKNGSGKSSVLKFLKTIFSQKRDFFHNYFLIVKSTNRLLLLQNINKSKNEPIEIINLDNSKIEISHENREISSLVDLVFYSNSLSIYDDISSSNITADISLYNYLHIHARKSNKYLLDQITELEQSFSEEERKSNDNFEIYKNSLLENTTPFQFSEKQELLEQIEFVSNYVNDDRFPFVPNTIVVYIDYDFINDDLQYYEEIGLMNKIKGFFDYRNERSYKYYGPENENIYKGLLQEELIFSIFLYTIKRGYYTDKDHKIEDIVNAIIDTKDYKQSTAFILKILLNSEPTSYYGPDYRYVKNFVKNLDSLIDRISFINYLQPGYLLAFDDNLKILISEVFKFWSFGNFIISFHWGGLSAGESSLLTLFSRIFRLRKDFLRNTIWILIDEGELYLHPEWQRHFFNNLHYFLPKFFENQKLQLFLTSHSPFIVSDLPKENIILLDQGEYNSCRIIDKSNMSNTFGANINELLANAYFLDKGAVGEFALIKINDLFNFFNDEKSNENWDSDTSYDFIELIGEPILKRHFLQLYDKKFGANQEIIYLESEIAKLKKRKEQ